MPVYAEIFEWSKALSPWQRDALRRLMLGAIDDAQLEDLEHICAKPYGLSLKDEDIVSNPLQEAHLPISGATDADVLLNSITEVHNVNLIDPTTTLGFGPDGLTIIYGYNGSGKSGYTRILKRVCRSRDGGSTIHPNVFEDHDGKPATATISYTSGSSAGNHPWTDGQFPPVDLSRVCIFDTNCAEFYVTKDNDVAYRPFGLDLFDKLAATADALHQKLETRKATYALQCPQPPTTLLQLSEFKGIYPVTAKTDPLKIDAVPALTPEEDTTLTLLKRAVEEENPIKKAAALRARKGRLNKVVDLVKSVADILNPVILEGYQAHVKDLQTAQEQSRLLSSEAFSSLLPETGGSAWRGLWNAAKAFASVAYPALPFPNISDEAACLLCQQPLGPEAKIRFADFEAFVTKETADKLTKAQSQIKADIAALVAMELQTTDEDVLDELRSHQEEWATVYTEYKKTSAASLQAVKNAFETGAWDSIAVPEFDTVPILNASKSLEDEAVATLAPDNAAELLKRTEQIASLEARKWIASNRDVLKADVQRAKNSDAITKAIGTTNTAAISRKSTELTKSHVTDALAKAVETELTAINANHLRITLTSRSAKGVTFHRIDIKDRKIDHVNVKDIVSEGEFRAIALAAFFAELSQSQNKSAIVVDDPVSSLDHLHRERAAQRLVVEAKQRQVIVFTHEVLFMRALIDAVEAEDETINLCLRHVTRGNGLVGLVEADIPWDTQKVKQRVHNLSLKLAEVKKIHTANRTLYETVGRDWYGHLRETWESTVEELALNGCIQRMRLSVETKKLEKVTDLTPADYKTIEAGMTKTSRWMRGHTKPIGDTTPFPEPAELDADFKSLSDFVGALRARR